MDASAPPPPLPRIVLKQSKMDIEADEDMTGSTAKLHVPKARLRHGKLLVKLSWDDVHVYSLAPWMRELLLARKGLSSLQEDLLPLLIARQFRGKMATFGKSLDQKSQETEETEGIQKSNEEDSPYSVVAVVLEAKAVVRANTVSAYHFACRETVTNGERLTMPTESTWNGKFQTLVLKDTTLGAKINMKSSVVGRGCELGAKCRLNNVVVMDNVIIGENCSLQNTLIGSGAKLGNNCSLNDCQVGPGKEIEAGTKEKGESFMVGDATLDDLF
jgi:translation initiation factor eIF-2B subunit gamma